MFFGYSNNYAEKVIGTGLVGPLDLLDPNVEHAEFLVDQALEVVRLLQHVIDAAHQEGEKAQSNKLHRPVTLFVKLTSRIMQKIYSLVVLPVWSP
jgi:hypothetical protein